MRKVLAALLLLVSLPAWGVISGTALQAERDSTGGNSETIDATDGWSAPTVGSCLVVGIGIDNTGGNAVGNLSCPAGFTEITAHETDALNRTNGILCLKEADGTETSITGSTPTDYGDLVLVAMELPGTDIDCSVDGLTPNFTNENVQTKNSGAVLNGTADSLNVYAFILDTDNLWTGATTNTCTIQESLGTSAQAGLVFATEVVSTAASRSCDLTTTDTGSQAIAAAFSLPASASGSTTTCTDDTIDPDGSQNIVCNLDVAFTGNVTKLVCGSDELTSVVSATTSGATFSITPGDVWTSTGLLNNTELGTAVNCHLANASETSTADSLTFNLQQSGNGWAAETTCDQDGLPAPCDSDSIMLDDDFPTGLDAGDDVFLVTTSGTITGLSNHAVLSGNPPLTADVFIWDESAGAWLGSNTLTAPEVSTCTTNTFLSPYESPYGNSIQSLACE